MVQVIRIARLLRLLVQTIDVLCNGPTCSQNNIYLDSTIFYLGQVSINNFQ